MGECQLVVPVKRVLAKVIHVAVVDLSGGIQTQGARLHNAGVPGGGLRFLTLLYTRCYAFVMRRYNL